MSTLATRKQNFLGLVFVLILLGMLGIAGAVETQELPTCNDHQAAQNWQGAWKDGCPFQDEQENYLYTWTP
jgi:hypothetical protein